MSSRYNLRPRENRSRAKSCPDFCKCHISDKMAESEEQQALKELENTLAEKEQELLNIEKSKEHEFYELDKRFQEREVEALRMKQCELEERERRLTEKIEVKEREFAQRERYISQSILELRNPSHSKREFEEFKQEPLQNFADEFPEFPKSPSRFQMSRAEQSPYNDQNTPVVIVERDFKKPSSFHGRDSEDIMNYLEKFERVCEYNRWSTNKRLHNLIFCLESKAATWLTTQPREIKNDFNLLKQALKNKYCSESRIWLERQALLQRKMKLNENLEDYIEEITRRSTKIKMSENDVVFTFVAGLKTSLRKYVALKHPRTLDEACAFAIEKNLIDQACDEDEVKIGKDQTLKKDENFITKGELIATIRDELHRSDSKSEPAEKLVAAFSGNQHNQISNKSNERNFDWNKPRRQNTNVGQEALDAINQRLDLITEALFSSQNKPRYQSQPHNSLNSQRIPPQNNFQRTNNFSQLTCWNCGVVGHISTTCPMPKYFRQQQQHFPAKMQDFTNSVQMPPQAPQYFSPNRNARATQFGSQNRSNTQTPSRNPDNFVGFVGPQTCTHTAEVETFQIVSPVDIKKTESFTESVSAIKSKETKTCETKFKYSPRNFTIDCSINDQHLSALLDTGASVSIMTKECAEKCGFDLSVNLNNSNMESVYSVNGQSIPILSEIDFLINIADQEYLGKTFVVEKSSYGLILGRDFLEAYDAKIDLKENSIRLTQLQNKSQISNEMSTVIQLNKGFKLPKRAECILPAKLRSPPAPGTTGFVEKSENLFSKYGILGASELVTVSEIGTIPFRLVNPHDYEIFLDKGVILGTFDESFEIHEQKPNENEINLLDLETNTDEIPVSGDLDECPVDISENSLSPEQNRQLRDLVMEYRDVFAKDSTDLGRTSLIKHQIDTGDNSPIRLRAYRMSPSQREKVEAHINEMLEQDVIEPSFSPWAAPVVLVSKKDKQTTRFCVDYRKLNAVTKMDSFPMPRIDDSLDALSNAQYFSTLDLKSGYHQIEMDENSMEKTAFTTHIGLFQFKTMPFGLCTAPSTFQRNMSEMFRQLQFKILLIYLDDIIIFGKTFEDHLVHIREVFDRLRLHNVKLNAKKCCFVKPEVPFLGHIITPAGLKCDPAKIEVIKSYPQPKNSKQVKSFVGLASYYRKYIRGFSQIASALYHLTGNRVKFEWTDDCQQAFETLKSALISAPILAYPDFETSFEIHVDASDQGLGYVLSQIQNGKEVVIAYGGRTLNSAERNYSVTERECLALVDGIKHFKVYLLGREFIAYTDHNALKYLMSCKNPAGKLARWALELQQYNFTIKHRPGSQNSNADALSRREYVTALDSPGVQTDRIYEFQRRDNDLIPLISYLESKELPGDDKLAKTVLHMSDSYFLDEDGILNHIWHDPGRRRSSSIVQLVIPENLKYEVLTHGHDAQFAGHFGITKTYEKLRRRYFWVNMYRDVQHWVRSCTTCQTRKSPKHSAKAPLLPIPVGRPFERLGVDILGPLVPTNSGNRYILVFTDALTKWPEIFALPSTEASVIADILVNNIICRFGSPDFLLSDRGKNFLSNLVAEVCKLTGIKKINTTSYHPQCNGQTERLNSSILNCLSAYVDKYHKTWDLFINSVAFAYRVSPHESTLESPFFLLYGRDCRLPIDTSLLKLTDPPNSIDEHKARIIQTIEEAQNIARENVQLAQQKMKAHYDKRANAKEYIAGDKVWVYSPKSKKGFCKKLLHCWDGPFRVVERKSPNTYSIKFPSRSKHDVVHVNRLKLFISQDERPQQMDFVSFEDTPDNNDNTQCNNDESDQSSDNFEPSEINPDSSQKEIPDQITNSESETSDIFQVEKLLDKRTRKGITKYLVKWCGYPMSANTWEPEENFIDKTSIEIFERNFGTKSKKGKKVIKQNIAAIRANEIFRHAH